MRLNKFWKGLSFVLLTYTLTAGLILEVPRLAILNETIRNLYFHVPMWFGMLFLLLVSAFHSVKFLMTGNEKNDFWASESANSGMLFGILGLTTGMWWANFTWGDFWSGDPKQNGSAVAMLFYLGYFVLRGAIDDEQKKGRISAVYNIFALAMYIPLIYVLPRLTSSLHPGSGGNPGFNAYDLDFKLRLVFYPAVAGWILLGLWLTELRVRMRAIQNWIQ
jgi:heme exporter protein C